MHAPFLVTTQIPTNLIPFYVMFRFRIVLALVLIATGMVLGEIVYTPNTTIVVASCRLTPIVFGCGESLNNVGTNEINIVSNVTYNTSTECKAQLINLKKVPQYATNLSNCTRLSANGTQQMLPYIPNNPYKCESYWFNVLRKIRGQRVSQCNDMLSAMLGESCLLIDDKLSREFCQVFSSVADEFLFAYFKTMPVLDLACVATSAVGVRRAVPIEPEGVATLACGGMCSTKSKAECENHLYKHNGASSIMGSQYMLVGLLGLLFLL